MKKPNFKIDGTTALGVLGGVMVLAGQVVKGVVDKKNADAKLAEAVEKAVNEKLQGK